MFKKISTDEQGFLDKNYPVFIKSMIIPLVALIIDVIAMIAVGFFGEASFNGKLVFWISSSMMAFIFALGLFVQVLSRIRVRNMVFAVDIENSIAYRYGKELGDIDRGRAKGKIVKELTDGKWVEILALKFKEVFPYEDYNKLWSPLTFVTFRRYGNVIARVGNARLVVRGVEHGRWVEVSILIDGKGIVRPSCIGLVLHELSHVPLSRMFPNMSNDQHHNIMENLGV